MFYPSVRVSWQQRRSLRRTPTAILLPFSSLDLLLRELPVFHVSGYPARDTLLPGERISLGVGIDRRVIDRTWYIDEDGESF